MKKNLKALLFAIPLALLVACGDDDSSTTPDNGGTENNGGTDLAVYEGAILRNKFTGKATLDASTEYVLTEAFVIAEGGELTIPAGTKISAAGGTASYIAVDKDSKIFINGTAEKPVIMTSASSQPKAGDWGGLVVCGQAPTNKGTENVTSEVAELKYGGAVAAHSSGSITYLRVEYTGASFNDEKQFNGVSFFGVGSGTKVEYVQSFNGKDDGIEFFGGTVTGNYLVSIGSGDDSIDFADGWAGNGANWYIAGGAKAGLEGSNNGSDGNATPVTTTTLKNITVVGPVGEGILNFKEGGGNFTIENLYATNVDKAIKVKSSDDPAKARIDADKLVITNITIENKAADYTATDYGTDLFTETTTATGAGNKGAFPAWAAGWAREN